MCSESFFEAQINRACKSSYFQRKNTSRIALELRLLILRSTPFFYFESFVTFSTDPRRVKDVSSICKNNGAKSSCSIWGQNYDPLITETRYLRFTFSSMFGVVSCVLFVSTVFTTTYLGLGVSSSNTSEGSLYDASLLTTDTNDSSTGPKNKTKLNNIKIGSWGKSCTLSGLPARNSKGICLPYLSVSSFVMSCEKSTKKQHLANRTELNNKINQSELNSKSTWPASSAGNTRASCLQVCLFWSDRQRFTSLLKQ